MTFKFRLGFFLASYLLLLSCEFPYEPEIEEPAISINPVTSSESGVLIKKIVPQNQICNPSISLDTINFAACMLWLNFGGDLPVKTTAVTSGFPLWANMHDRLTISDTSNTVRWYMMNNSITEKPAFRFQDPEWSTHPEYIGTLFGDNNVFDRWSFYAIHPLSNSYIKIIDSRLNETSTPHLWVEPGISSLSHHVPIDTSYDINGFLNKDAIASFFGTSKVKIAYSIRENGYLSIYYIDYSSEVITPIKLPAPAGGLQYNYESPLISPDGNWIVFNAYQTTTQYKSYIQKLSHQSKPVLLKDGACDPHWWVSPSTGQLYIVYAEIDGDYNITSDLADQKHLASGASGSTSMLKAHLNPKLPSALAVELDPPVTILHLPLKGGLSPDGHFLCTGYTYAYIVELL